jgi:hypothetical protein
MPYESLRRQSGISHPGPTLGNEVPAGIRFLVANGCAAIRVTGISARARIRLLPAVAVRVTCKY